ncbi:MAG: SLBB domain-containing protein, partial [Roseimicrobium sp.]
TKALAQYIHNPRVMVTPHSFNSRKVYILGKVIKKGMVNYDRPLSLVEAVTEAGGLETGLFMQNTVELADLSHSFLSRKGQRVKLDFEALFLRGDMTQNVMLQPDDYIYFPSANSNEIYVLGAVRSQGTQGLLAQSTVTSVIVTAGGFTSRAYKERVLVVRGALEKPQSFVVNMSAVMQAREKGFRLEPKDIVYIADKPWAQVEELLDLALTAFIQGAVSSYRAGAVGPLITKPLIQLDAD